MAGVRAALVRLAARLDSLPTDLGLAVLITVAGLVQVLVAPIAAPGLGELFVVGTTVPLAWRRTHPVAACVVSSVFWLVPTTGYPLLGFVTALLLFFSLGAAEVPGVRVVATTASASACGVVGTLLGPESAAAVISAVLVVVAPVVAGLAVRYQRRQSAALEALTRELEADQILLQQSAVSAERARIAHELHDVLGHELTLIAIQAEAAGAALERSPERAAPAVESIRTTAHQALSQIRSTLDVLAPEAPDAGSTTDPSIDLVELSARASQAGIAHRLRVSGTPWPGQAAVGLAVNRIVRECLTNAGRHAPGSVADVVVAWGPDAVDVRVSNEVGARVRVTPSRGLVGMRHRAELLGGTFEAGLSGSTFCVHARIPAPVRVTDGLPA